MNPSINFGLGFCSALAVVAGAGVWIDARGTLVIGPYETSGSIEAMPGQEAWLSTLPGAELGSRFGGSGGGARGDLGSADEPVGAGETESAYDREQAQREALLAEEGSIATDIKQVCNLPGGQIIQTSESFSSRINEVVAVFRVESLDRTVNYLVQSQEVLCPDGQFYYLPTGQRSGRTGTSPG